MIVKKRMTSNPATALPSTTHREAVELMREGGYRWLPVLDKKGKLVGIVSEIDLLSTAPSPATTLSVYEIYSLLDKLTLDQIMSSPVITIDPECNIAAAARIMIDNRVGCLPVMEGDKLVGIITETDIYKTFVEVLGGGQPGLRIELRVEDKPGTLAAVAQAVADADGNILALTVFRAEDSEHAELSIKDTGSADEKKLKDNLNKIGGVEIVDIHQSVKYKPRSFGK